MKKMNKHSKGLNIALWTAQVVLAAGFIWASSMKLFQSPEKLAEMWPWTAENVFLVKITGILDLLAGTGLILPGLLRFQPKITFFAAVGTIVLMIAAIIFHVSRGEASLTGVNFFFAAAALFVAWGRK
jgi:uncharacterized membrane protein YphA (DoxX/SURF4 family)